MSRLFFYFFFDNLVRTSQSTQGEPVGRLIHFARLAGGSAHRLQAILSVVVLGGILMMPNPGTAATFIYTDETFNNSDWDLTLITLGNVGSATGQQVASGGNLGAYRQVIDVVATSGDVSSSIFGFHRHIASVYDPGTQGAIQSLNYDEDNRTFADGFGDGQVTGAAVRQNGQVYFVFNVTGLSNPDWQHLSNTNLTAADFGLIATDLYDPVSTPTSPPQEARSSWASSVPTASSPTPPATRSRPVSTTGRLSSPPTPPSLQPFLSRAQSSWPRWDCSDLACLSGVAAVCLNRPSIADKLHPKLSGPCGLTGLFASAGPRLGAPLSQSHTFSESMHQWTEFWHSGRPFEGRAPGWGNLSPNYSCG